VPEVWTGAGGAAGRGPLVSRLVAHHSQVAVIGGDVHGDIVFGGELRTPPELVLDFAPVVDPLADEFVGRQQVFDTLTAFAGAHDRGYVEIIADAGLGKTALAAAVSRRFDAIPFFASQSGGLTLPKQFLTHVCASLITRYALPHAHVPSRAGEDGTFLARLLEEASTRAMAPIWIVVDALDEAEAPPPRANPLLLPAHLPARVYVVVTQRPGGRVWTQPDTPRVPVELRAETPQQLQDIEAYIRARAARGRLPQALREGQPPVDPEALVRTLTGASRGNFMYVSYMLGDIEAREPGAPLDLAHLPDGLHGYYEQFWADMAGTKAEGWADWKGLYRPVIERLAVAMEAVSARWLAAQVGRDADEVRERALLRWTRLLSQDAVEGEVRWRVIHRSFADFLATKVDLPDAHRAVASFYAIARRGQADQYDPYGLRHTPAHLAAAAAGAGDEATRHVLTETLAALVLEPGYQQHHLAQLRDPLAFEAALALALEALARDPLATPPRLTSVALRLVAFRKEQRQPQPIFDLAAAGEVQAAERRLDLFALDVDAAWYDALLLTIAWLAAARNRDAARRLRDRVMAKRAALPRDAGLDLLLARVGSALDDVPLPALTLPDPPAPEEAQAIVLRLQASAVDQSLMPGAAIELLHRRELSAGPGGYLAQDDAPALVALARHVPAVGEPLLQEYVALHAGYGYREYRQASLAWLLRAVLQHPAQEWVLARVAALGGAVLAPNRGEFRESLRFAALARLARAGDADALAMLDRHVAEAVAASDASTPAREGPLAGQMPRGSGDAWGTHRRRLAAGAEALSRLPARDGDARGLLPRALGLRWGFAGFNAPACLAVADAIVVVAADAAAEEKALAMALQSAHNIQDATFCVRTTARVQALRADWSAPPAAFDAGGTATRLVRDPAAPAFSARHVIGQTYDDRDPGTTVPLGDHVRDAASLRQLSAIYGRPLEDFQRSNAGAPWSPDDPIPAGTPVRVPDPGFPPLLCARIAARALADGTLTDAARAAAIRLLVPLAAADVTALDLVLARMVLASSDLESTALVDILQMAEQAAAAAPPDSALGAQLTRFVP
jgi:hypothetical protein